MNTNKMLSALALTVTICLSARLASAQYYPQQQYPPQYPAAYNGYGYYHHASTLEEGAANGIANLIHSSGAANLLYSQASRNYEEAQSRYLDNRVKAAVTFVERKKIKKDYAASLRVPSPSREEAARYAKERAPERLSSRDFDPLTGRIWWPVALEDDAFKSHRERLDELVLKWVRFRGHLGPDEYLALQRSAKAMQTELKRHIKDYPAADYVKAKNVLESLAYEVARNETASVLVESEEPAGTVAAR